MTEHAREELTGASDSPGAGLSNMDRATFLKLTATGSAAALAGYSPAAASGLRDRSTRPTGTFTFLAAQELDATDWNPFSNTNLSNMILNPQIYDYLVNRDMHARLIPGLATAWRNISPKEWEFDLRRGVHFHDGQPFTAKDVKASLEYAAGPKAATAFFWAGVQPQVEIVNNYRVRLHTSLPDGFLLGGTLSGGKGGIIVSHRDLQQGKLSKKVNGTGPFKFVRYEGDQGGVHMVANQHYWGGAPGTAVFYFRAISDSNVRLAALLGGQANVIERVEPDQAKFLANRSGIHLQRVNSTENKWLVFRVTKPPFNNKILRQAIAHAIDTETIVKRILLGSGKACTTYLTPTQEFYQPAASFPRYNPQKAKELLAKAGYPGGKGLPVIEYLTSTGFYPKTKEYGEFIVQNLAAIGVRVQLKVIEEATWYTVLFEPGQGHMADTGWFVPMTDPQVLLYSLFGQQVITQGKNPELTRAIVEEGGTIDKTKRAQLMHEKVIPLLSDQVTQYPLFTSQLITAVRSNTHDFIMPPIDEFRARYVKV